MFFKKLRYKITSLKTVPEVFSKHLHTNGQDFELGEMHFLAALVQVFRPDNPKMVDVVSIRPLIDYLTEHPEEKRQFQVYLHAMVSGRDFRSILTESGILQNKNFTKELRKRIFAKFIPYQPKANSLEFLMAQVFYAHSDFDWIAKIPMSELEELITILEIDSIYQPYEHSNTFKEIFEALTLISQRISGRALEGEVLQMVPEFSELDSPFEGLEKELDRIVTRFETQNLSSLQENDEDMHQLLLLHQQCVSFVDKAYQNSSIYGISMTVNQSLLRIKQQLQRFKSLIGFIVLEEAHLQRTKSIEFGLKLIRYHCHKNNIRKLFNESTQIIAYEVTQHSAKTGEHYITTGKKEYFNMLLTAMGGGLIVGFLCVFKILLGKVEVSDFGHAFLYSMNYALGFIAIYLLGFTLATKQPAMTAAALVASIEQGMKSNETKDRKHRAFAELFARLFRSQFIAFVGNVIIAFPVSLLLILGIDLLVDVNIAETKHETLLHDISPLHSMAIFHAAIAGVFLFLSGIISGSISNKNKHINLYYRIQEHPILKMGLGKNRTKKIASWFEKKWPGVASNFWFGVFMGTTASIGVFFGLNLDIRHITFASGNLALGIYGGDFEISNFMLFLGIFGVAMIGLINFIVSFLLSLYVAFRSRQIPWSELKYLFLSTWDYFKRRPVEFFFPVKAREGN